MEEPITALMEEHRPWIQQQISEQNQKIEEQQQQLMTQMLNQFRFHEERAHSNFGSGVEIGSRNNLHFNPKVFPTFNGIDPKGWVKTCTRYFSMCRIGDKWTVDLAVSHLKGPAETWFSSILR